MNARLRALWQQIAAWWEATRSAPPADPDPPAPSQPDHAALAVVVRDAATGSVLPGAFVTLHTGEEGVTNSDGYVSFQRLAFGERGVEVRRSGYVSTRVSVRPFVANREVAVDLVAQWAEDDDEAMPPAPSPAPAPAPAPPPPPAPNPPSWRAPDPPPGHRLPLPNMRLLVESVARERPDLLARSCQEHGGTWEFLDLVVDRLRAIDARWGYNWKRGNVGDPSLDVVAYHYGAGPSEGSTDVYIIDVIAGHCGPNPSPAWIDQTEATRQAGAIGRWTSRGRW